MPPSSTARASSSAAEGTRTSHRPATITLREVKSRVPPLNAWPANPNAAPITAPHSTAQTTSAKNEAVVVVNSPRNRPTTSPNTAPLTAPERAARALVSRPVTVSSRRRSLPTMATFCTGYPESERESTAR